MSAPPHAPTSLALAHSVLRGAASPASPALAATFEQRYTQMRRRLVDLLGPMGFAALFSRALYLAQETYPALETIGLELVPGAADRTGELRGANAFAADRTPEETEVALTGILVAFSGLLHLFIGEDLALRLLREAWSTAPTDSGDE